MSGHGESVLLGWLMISKDEFMEDIARRGALGPKSRARQSLLKRYRSRGHRNSNLWLVFSVKTARDWIVDSDVRLIYWLLHLESNPDVQSFDLDPEITSHSSRGVPRTRIDAEVLYKDGHAEWHRISDTAVSGQPSQADQLADALASKCSRPLRLISRSELSHRNQEAMHWLTALAYAAVLRNETNQPTVNALATLLHQNPAGGTVKEILEMLTHHDQATLVGIIIRLAITGTIHLDLTKKPFGYLTEWQAHVTEVLS